MLFRSGGGGTSNKWCVLNKSRGNPESMHNQQQHERTLTLESDTPFSLIYNNELHSEASSFPPVTYVHTHFQTSLGISISERIHRMGPLNCRTLAQQCQEVIGDFLEDQTLEGHEKLNARWDLHHTAEVG